MPPSGPSLDSGAAAGFAAPSAVVVMPDGSIAVACPSEYRIWRLTPDLNSRTLLYVTGVAGSSFPRALWTDPYGNLCLLDLHSVRKVSGIRGWVVVVSMRVVGVGARWKRTGVLGAGAGHHRGAAPAGLMVSVLPSWVGCWDQCTHTLRMLLR